MDTILSELRTYVRRKLEREGSGHDWHHIDRVVKQAKRIADEESANTFICEVAALVHDLADDKVASSEQEGIREVEALLYQLKAADREHVMEIITTISYKGGNRPPVKSLEAQVVQDADRLDAIGAIGIARTFVYAGSKAELIYDPSIEPRTNMTMDAYRNEQSTAINHFYEKLLKLKDLMNTETGKSLAEERHEFIQSFLSQFHGEWEGNR
ncbi:HD domain-containing protein [Alkalihalobacillus hwajinpoensis]|uniref:HD domain-containing protein n=1 Tax=Guptibacillus hwajinpoensis TaxID=208199 RepID=UPI001884475E|nr:HD domain-containing protein [Pseudalkalibacillus hwajinpoensis]MBF0708109.1 HD domain-containing protein [Pseudalkalibacillus hwajinpoensis]